MIIDRKHVSWGIGTAVATVVIGVFYYANSDPVLLKKWHVPLTLPNWFGASPPVTSNYGATPLGLIYGTAALLIFLFAALLGARRSHKTVPIGRIQTWLRAHVWLTIFTIPLVLFHCGFHGGGPMTQFLLWLYALVMLSGFWGLFLQNIVPRIMREQLPEEVVFEQIPYVREQLLARTQEIREDLFSETKESELVDSHGAPATTQAAVHAVPATMTIRFLDEEVIPYLTSPRPRGSALHEKRSSDNQFRLLKLQVPVFLHPALDSAQNICDEKRRLDRQVRLHYWLHGWLIFHAPSSILLVVLTIVHAIVGGFFYN